VGEKGNVVDPGASVMAAGPSIVERTTTVATSTVMQTADTLRDKAIGVGADHAIGEVRDRLKERRNADDASATEAADPEVPPPPPSSSPA
jgi:hypothetical protein